MILDIARLQTLIESKPEPAIDSSVVAVQSAVFVLLVQRQQTNIVLIRRADGAGPWAGHFALPGGHIEPTDADALAAAFREVNEEIGVAQEAISHTSVLGQFMTLTGFVSLNAFVGEWAGLTCPTPNAAEVAEVFELPLIDLWQHSLSNDFACKDAEQIGPRLVFPAPAGDIWGVTARIIHHLLHVATPLFEGSDSARS